MVTAWAMPAMYALAIKKMILMLMTTAFVMQVIDVQVKMTE